MNRKTLFLAALGILLVTFVFGTSFYYVMNKGKASQLPEANQTALMRMHSPALGKNDALVVIVEFFDPACGTCAAFYPLVKQLMAANPDRIRLVLRYTPFHVGSDKVVAVLEATRKQGKFWQALEALLKSQSEWAPNHTAQVGLVWRQLEGLGLDFEKVRVDMEAPEVARVIAQDVEDARALNVTKTPEYFVNGKPLPSFGFDQLKKLVDDALKASAGR